MVTVYRHIRADHAAPRATDSKIKDYNRGYIDTVGVSPDCVWNYIMLMLTCRLFIYALFIVAKAKAVHQHSLTSYTVY